MKTVVNDIHLIAYCGLYCGACGAYLKERCPGCRENIKADRWCKIRVCCTERKYASCAECTEFADVNACKKFNNLFSKFFAWVFRSDRKACIGQIREKGRAGHADIMAREKKPSLKRGQR
ncbi:MAG: DUF3795 domain-containing protein [Fibrobacterota bacterium]